MQDVSQMTDEALVGEHGRRVITWKTYPSLEHGNEMDDTKFELLRRLRLAANARPEQVTLAMVQEAVDVGLVYAPELSNWLVPDLRKVAEIAKRSLAQLPWPQGSGALHPLPKEGWREVDDALAASTQAAQTEVEDGD